MAATDSTPHNDELARRRAATAARRNLLAHRLEDGYGRIDQAIANGAEVVAWEEFWIQLLREYESVCDDLREAA